MTILWCCSQVRHRKKPHGQQESCEARHSQRLPTRPAPARLPPRGLHGIVLSPSTAARTLSSSPLPGHVAEDSIRFAELVIEDSEEDDAGLIHTSRNRSTSTLEAVKARIRRHLSQDSINRRSESEEQIARRAEVKRLMRMRIQEELQSDSHPVRCGNSTPHPTPSSIASATLPHNGPRDTIEFAMSEFKKENDLTRAKTAHVSRSSDDDERRISRTLSRRSSALSRKKEARKPSSRPISLRGTIERDAREAQADPQSHACQCSSLPGTSASPQMRSAHSYEGEAASLAPWRLSLSAEKPSDMPAVASPTGSHETSKAKVEGHRHLRRMRSRSSPLAGLPTDTINKADQTHVSVNSDCRSRQIPESHSLVRDESPVGLWLRAQSQQSCFSASPLPSEHEAPDHFDGRAQDGPGPRTPPSVVILPLLPRFSSDSGERETSGKAHADSPLRVDTPELFCDEKETIRADNPGRSNSLQSPSQMRTGSDILTTVVPGVSVPGMVRRGLAGMRLPSFRWHGNKSQKECRPAPPPKFCAAKSALSLAHSHIRRTTLEAGSETSSFFRREVELRAVEERFRDSHLRKEPLTPVESKFHEVLSDGSYLAAILPRPELTLLTDQESFTHNFDGKGPDQTFSTTPAVRESGAERSDHRNAHIQGHLQVPSTEFNMAKSVGKNSRLSNYSDGSPRSRGFSSSRDGDETAEMWKRALRASGSKSPKRSTSSQRVTSQYVGAESKDDENHLRAPCPSKVECRSGSDSLVQSPACIEPPTQEDEEQFRQSLIRSNKVLEDWSQQLKRQEHNAVTNICPLTCGPRPIYTKPKTPPASWARFPSHNREERNAAAGESDNVKPRDFAVKEMSAAGIITWTTDKVVDGGPRQRSIVRSVSDKFTQPFKSRWSKLIPGRADVQFRNRSMRGSIQAYGDLEYPELELLPKAGGYKELLALEREINEMKGHVEPKLGADYDQSANSVNKSSLVEKMVDVLQGDGSIDAEIRRPKDVVTSLDTEGSFSQKCLPTTPAAQMKCLHQVPGKDETSSSGERYATPLTQFSFSRPPTPQSADLLPASAHTPHSIQSDASVIRHKSLCLPKKNLDMSDRSSGRRRSAPPCPSNV